MSNGIDHKQISEDFTAYIDALGVINGWTPVSDLEVFALAQVHATMYAAEQQRIANLIAYWAAMTNESFAYLDDEAKAMFRGVQEQIEKGLDLA